jgi:hypothetical protein
MGLLVTEATELGVVMAGDGPRAFAVSRLGAAVGFGGMDEFAGVKTGGWLADFVNRVRPGETVGAVARGLADEVSKMLGPIPDGRCNLGFHVAGHERDGQGDYRPSFYHVHAGLSQALQMRGEATGDETRFNANHDLPPDLARQRTAGGRVYLTHNGDFLVYATLLRALGEWFGQLRQRGVSVPLTPNLAWRAEFLAFQFRAAAGACRFSSLGPVVAEDVRTVALPPPQEQEQE